MEHDQWLQWRRSGIGSSDAPVVMGVSPWKTPYQLWKEKLTGVNSQKENSSMERGKRLEAEARDAFSNILKTELKPKNVENDKISWLRASLDGIDASGQVMVEIKCPGREDHSQAMNRLVPAKYWPQLQHQMLVADLKNMYYVSYSGTEIAWVNVERDESYVSELFSKEKEFWECVLNKNAPELTEKDYINLEKNSEWSKIAHRLIEVQLQLKDLEIEETGLKTRLTDMCQSRNAMGGGIKATNTLCKGGIDYKQAMVDYPDIPWETYRKDSFVKWTFRSIS